MDEVSVPERTYFLHGDPAPGNGLFLCRCCDLWQSPQHFRVHPKEAHIARYRHSLRVLAQLSKKGYVRGGDCESNLISKAWRVGRARIPQQPMPPKSRPIVVHETAINRVLPRLAGLIQTGLCTWMARCPAHKDRTPSLSVRLAGDKVLLHCFAGCPISDIVAAIGLELRDLFDLVRAVRRGTSASAHS